MRNYLDALADNITKKLQEIERKPAWLAQKSGVKKSNLSRLLRKEGNPTLDTIVSIAKALDMDPDDLLAPTDLNIDEKAAWYHIPQIEKDLRVILQKRAQVEVMFNETMDPEEIRDLIKSKEVLDEKAHELRDRIKSFKLRDERKVKPKQTLLRQVSTTLSSLNDDQLRLVSDYIGDITRPAKPKAIATDIADKEIIETKKSKG
ncbi:MAG: helix-turn-helix transcriptional regulator [Nitrosomonas sp.]|nr:helix-turn-helix transcriptional regulator [Nitrosomonas sp.]